MPMNKLAMIAIQVNAMFAIFARVRRHRVKKENNARENVFISLAHHPCNHCSKKPIAESS